MIVTYDMDGVLALNPPPNIKKWGHMNGAERNARKEFLYDWYENAELLFNPPEEKFHVISARKKDQRTWEITSNWLNKYFPNRILSINLLNTSRTVKNVVDFKSSIINHINSMAHTEDNVRVLKGLKKLCPETKLYFWEKGMTNPIIFHG
ncbi:hypothetical protein EBU71_04180 [bacterium]|nr:hypothetical protein [Candidatus Elulimicrobium humile]